MTLQDSFKRRIRERMAKTGERHAASRRALVQQVPKPGGRVWISQPEVNGESIRKATDRGWD